MEIKMQYIEINVNEFRKAEHFFSKIIYRLHGYSRKNNTCDLGIDFPKWHVAGVFEKISLGNSLRIFGSRQRLTDFMLKTNLMEFLIQGGVAMSGIQDVPDGHGYVKLKRDNKIQKRNRLIGNISKINYDQVKTADVSLQNLASEMGIDIRLATEMNKILKERHSMLIKTGVLRVESVSKSNGLTIHLSREVVDVAAGQDFSTYGLGKGATTVPFF
jgi:CRISPR-associated endoribonuclease Cas6/Csy4 subtype I-F